MRKTVQGKSMGQLVNMARQGGPVDQFSFDELEKLRAELQIEWEGFGVPMMHR